MRKKQIILILIPFFLILSVSLKGSGFLGVQSYIATDANNVLTTAGWSYATIISDDSTGWNDDSSWEPSVAVDGSGNVHVVWRDDTDGGWGTDSEIMYAKHNGVGWSNATVISDDATGWNDGTSDTPNIAIDNDGNVHVVWFDTTIGEWGMDPEIMYTNLTGAGWSNATVISDDATGWNDGTSANPKIAIDRNGSVHVVWEDTTSGLWGIDREIMYAKNTGLGWSNATVISDDATGWNVGDSYNPDIAIGGDGNAHVVWHDYTDGEWGTDIEIMYAKHNGSVWSNATAISDINGWNNGPSLFPAITIEGVGNIHVVWYDYTVGEWGTDVEIMYTKHTSVGWSNATVISDDATGWNDGTSVDPSIAIDGNGNVHVVWGDGTDGEWGTDDEIMYTEHNESGWSNVTVISDISGWNNGPSIHPSVAIDDNGNVHVVWYDQTDGVWGTDSEIMYSKKFVTQTSDDQLVFIIIPLPDSSISLLSPLGLGIIGIAMATTLIITVIVTKKIK